MRLLNNYSSLLIISLAALMGSGCALVDNELDLQYAVMERSPLQEIAPMRVEINVSEGRPESERARVGEVRNGYGMHMADVLTKESATVELRKALVDQFEAAGHQVVERDPQVRINMQLNKMDVASVFSWDVELVGQIDTTVSVFNPPTSLSPVKLNANGNATSTDAFAAHEGAREEALNQALAELMRSLIFNEAFLNSLRLPQSS